MEERHKKDGYIKRSIDIVRLKTRLLALRAKIAAEEKREESARDIHEMKKDVEQEYRKIDIKSEEQEKDKKEMERRLARLETQAREKTSDALETIEGLLEMLRKKVKK